MEGREEQVIKVATPEGKIEEWNNCNGFTTHDDGTLSLNRFGEVFVIYGSLEWWRVWDERVNTITHSVITSNDSLKMIREAICFVQSTMELVDRVPDADLSFPTEQRDKYQRILQGLVADIDRQRPLGRDGKHGNRHTAYCQCPDVALPSDQRDDDAHGEE